MSFSPAVLHKRAVIEQIFHPAFPRKKGQMFFFVVARVYETRKTFRFAAHRQRQRSLPARSLTSYVTQAFADPWE